MLRQVLASPPFYREETEAVRAPPLLFTEPPICITSPPTSHLLLRNEPALGITAKCPPFQFMSDPVLYQEKLLKPAVLLLEKGADQEEDEALRVLSLRALGNMALGAPKKVLCPALRPGPGS